MKMKTDSKLLKTSSKLILIENSTLLMDNFKIDEIPTKIKWVHEKYTPFYIVFQVFWWYFL